MHCAGGNMQIMPFRPIQLLNNKKNKNCLIDDLMVERIGFFVVLSINHVPMFSKNSIRRKRNNRETHIRIIDEN